MRNVNIRLFVGQKYANAMCHRKKSWKMNLQIAIVAHNNLSYLLSKCNYWQYPHRWVSESREKADLFARITFYMESFFDFLFTAFVWNVTGARSLEFENAMCKWISLPSNWTSWGWLTMAQDDEMIPLLNCAYWDLGPITCRSIQARWKDVKREKNKCILDRNDGTRLLLDSKHGNAVSEV